ncbi:hypothetical protein K4F52_005666 [Lecanicillium sp. MT-2017a]|nr:hypothetical protein K4F52_005666 [Lecanicillium sp. MT-2017a]
MPGQPLDGKKLFEATTEDTRRFYTQLGDILSQLRAQEFEYAGSLRRDSQGAVTIGAPHSVDLNTLQLQGTRRNIERQATAYDFAICHYEILFARLSLPEAQMDEEDAQLEVFALEDFKVRLPQLLDPSLNSQPFVLAHGDPRPSNILVNDKLEIEGIIDWEWSGTVPRQFFMPLLWLGGYEALSPRNEQYVSHYSTFYQALLDTAEAADTDTALAAIRTLADEWGPDLASSWRRFLPAALFHHHSFMTMYHLVFFAEFHKDTNRHDKMKEFYGSSDEFCEVVRTKVEASRRYTQELLERGLITEEKTAQELELDALLAKSAQLLAQDRIA